MPAQVNWASLIKPADNFRAVLERGRYEDQLAREEQARRERLAQLGRMQAHREAERADALKLMEKQRAYQLQDRDEEDRKRRSALNQLARSWQKRATAWRTGTGATDAELIPLQMDPTGRVTAQDEQKTARTLMELISRANYRGGGQVRTEDQQRAEQARADILESQAEQGKIQERMHRAGMMPTPREQFEQPIEMQRERMEAERDIAKMRAEGYAGRQADTMVRNLTSQRVRLLGELGRARDRGDDEGAAQIAQQIQTTDNMLRQYGVGGGGGVTPPSGQSELLGATAADLGDLGVRTAGQNLDQIPDQIIQMPDGTVTNLKYLVNEYLQQGTNLSPGEIARRILERRGG